MMHQGRRRRVVAPVEITKYVSRHGSKYVFLRMRRSLRRRTLKAGRPKEKPMLIHPITVRHIAEQRRREHQAWVAIQNAVRRRDTVPRSRRRWSATRRATTPAAAR
jgi:hypothetical protein